MVEQRAGHLGEVPGNAYLPLFHFVTDKRTEKIFRRCILQKYAGTLPWFHYCGIREIPGGAFKKYPNILFFFLLLFPSLKNDIDFYILRYGFCTIRTAALLCIK